MLLALNEFLKKHQSELEDILSSKTIERLYTANNSTQLKAWLLSEANTEQQRIIDNIITPVENLPVATLKQQLLNAIVANLTPTEWFDIIISPNRLSWKSNKKSNLIAQFLENHSEPAWLLDTLLFNLPNTQSTIFILTQSFVGKNGAETTLLLNKFLSIENMLSRMSTLSDDEKIQVFFSQTPKSIDLLSRAKREGKLNLLSQSLHNPEKQAEFKNMIFSKKIRNRATHFLGIKDKASSFNYQTNQYTYFSSENTVDKYQYEGMEEKAALKIFKKELNSYQPTQQFSAEFTKIKIAFNNIDEKAPLETQIETLEKNYKTNKFIVIPSGWPEHSITIGATDKFLIVGNRGQGKHDKGGCIVYPLIKPLTKKDIKIFCRQSSQADIEKHIESLVQKDRNNKPIISHAFPLKPQKYGTCAIANKKAVIAGALPLLHNATDLFYEPLLLECNKEYKKFSNHTRLSSLSELIEAFDNATNPALLLDGLADYCNQHLNCKEELETHLIQHSVTILPERVWEPLSEKLTVESKIILNYFKHNQTMNPAPLFIQQLKNRDSIINPDCFSPLYEYLEKHLPGEFEKLLTLRVQQREKQETPLMIAAYAGNSAFIKKLIHQQADINAKDNDGQSATMIALDRNLGNVAILLLDNGAKIDIALLTKAIKSNNSEVVLAILKKQPTLIDQALIICAQNAAKDLFKTLLQHQPGPSKQAIDKALCHAGNCSTGMVQHLLSLQANIDAISENTTPLLSAIKAKNAQLVTFLISNGANVNLETNSGTALSVACQCLTEEHRDIMLTLIKHEAKLPSKPLRRRGQVSPLKAAIKLNLSEYTQSLLEQATENDELLSSFKLAAEYARPEMMSSLLNKMKELYQVESHEILDEQDLSECLGVAIHKSEFTIAKIIIDYYGSLNKQPPPFWLLEKIRLIVESQQSEFAKLFIKKFRSFTENPEVYQYTLDILVENNMNDLVKILLAKGLDLDNIKLNHNPMSTAIRGGNISAIQMLLETNKNYVNGIGLGKSHYVTPLGLAIAVGQNNIARLLLKNGAYINAGEDTPLMCAARIGAIEVVKELIKRKVLLNQKDSEDESALSLALKYKKWETASLLIENGAEYDAALIQKYLFSVLKSAATYPNIALAFIEKLDKNTINMLDKNRSTPLHWAACTGPLSVVNALLAKNANTDQVNNSGNTALLYALTFGKTKIALSLLALGVTVNNCNKSGESPLMCVNNIEVATELLKHGANIDYCNNHGESAISIALGNRSPDMICLFIKHSSPRYLIEEFKKSNTLALFNKLSVTNKKEVIAALSSILSNEELAGMQLKDKDKTKAKPSIVAFKSVQTTSNQKTEEYKEKKPDDKRKPTKT